MAAQQAADRRRAISNGGTPCALSEGIRPQHDEDSSALSVLPSAEDTCRTCKGQGPVPPQSPIRKEGPVDGRRGGVARKSGEEAGGEGGLAPCTDGLDHPDLRPAGRDTHADHPLVGGLLPSAKRFGNGCSDQIREGACRGGFGMHNLLVEGKPCAVGPCGTPLVDCTRRLLEEGLLASEAAVRRPRGPPRVEGVAHGDHGAESEAELGGGGVGEAGDFGSHCGHLPCRERRCEGLSGELRERERGRARRRDAGEVA